MQQDLQVFIDSQRSFIFCDYNWQTIGQKSSQLSASGVDIYFQKHDDIYSWECGCCTHKKLIDAYLFHGNQFIEKVQLGNSAFVLYDAAKGIVVAARDFMGNYPLYYYESPIKKGNFIFSFSINALLASKLFEPTVNYAKVVEYVASSLYTRPNNHTFYQHIYRLLPAYLIRIIGGKINLLKRYGRFDLQKYLSFTEQDYVNRFRKLFIKSIKKQTAEHKKIALSLSGGLDSSSICSVVQSIRSELIHTFNFRPHTSIAQEDDYIDSVVAKWHNIHRTIQPTYSGYEAIKKITKQNAQPFFIFNHTIQLDLMAAAKQENCTVFLSGHWGDQVVGTGTQYLEELACKEDWENLKKSIEQYFQKSIDTKAATTASSFKNKNKLIKLYTIRLLWGKLKAQKQWTKLPAMIWVLNRYFNCIFKDFLLIIWQNLNKTKTIIRPKIDRLIRPEILAASDKSIHENPIEVLNVDETFTGPINEYQKRHLTSIFRGNQLYGQEEYFEIYRQNSLRSAQPFFDAELIELSLSIPLRIKFDEGRKRGTLRIALKDYLPEKIATRTTKANFTDHYVSLFKTLWQDFDKNTPDNHSIWTIVNKTVFDENVKILLNDEYHLPNRQVVMPPLIRIINLAIWLDYLKELEK